MNPVAGLPRREAERTAMRKLFLFAWLLLPVGAAAYHFGPGQDALRADRAADAASRARALVEQARAVAAKDGDEAARALWADAEQAFGEALESLPPGRTAETRALLLERAKAQMLVSQLPEARRALEGLVEDLAGDPTADPKQLADARSALANAQYYTTWLLRLEGAAREEWEPEIEASRQNYKLVAEGAERSGDTQLAALSRENLESSIRLARMELKDLQGLPLPSQ
jgi:hypothetical protein